MNVINVIFSVEEDGNILESEVLKQMDDLQQFMTQLGTFNKTVALVIIFLMRQDDN